jgi:organic radical activating enzyme
MPFVRGVDGRIESIKMEVNLVQHCNYGCQECSHFSPHLRAGAADVETFRRDLDALALVYHVGRFRFVGGEPLLNPAIGEFIAAVRTSGITNVIEVVTNGSLLHRADEALFEEIDSLSVSAYPDSRFDESKLARAADLCRQHGTKLKVNRIDRFRLMQLDAPIEDARLVNDLYRSCQIAHSWYCQTFADGWFYLCSRPLFTDAYLELKGASTQDLVRRDGEPLHEPDLYQRLRAYLGRTEPLASCSYCLGTAGRHIAWRQQSTAEKRSTEPLQRSARASLSHRRLRFLIGWSQIERAVLRVAPSLRLARGLTLAKDAVLRA